MVVTEKGDPHGILRLAKETQAGLGVGGAQARIRLVAREKLELCPAQGSVWFGQGRGWRAQSRVASPVSPVRIRMEFSTGVTVILPSPTSPVRAAA